MTKARDLADLGSTATSLDTVGSNLIINGAHTVDQRNSGSSANVTNGADHFIADRFRFTENHSGTFSAQQVSDAPVGFEKSSKITVTGTDSSLAAGEFARILQGIEGKNISHLNWGSANAKTCTLSFYVKSSVTGQYYVSINNNATNRNMLKGYTIDSADTWEKKEIEIIGDTAGTWLTTNAVGIYLMWTLGTGSTYQSSTTDAYQAGFYMGKSDQVNLAATNSATWQLTGCQLEVGSATDFEHEPYSVTLAKAQRYYQRQTTGTNQYSVFLIGSVDSTSNVYMYGKLNGTMRTSPSFATANTYLYTKPDNTVTYAATANRSGPEVATINFGTLSGGTAGNGIRFESTAGNGYVEYNAEL